MASSYVGDMKVLAVVTIGAYITTTTLKKAIEETLGYIHYQQPQTLNRDNEKASDDVELAMKMIEKGDAAFEAKKWNEAVSFYIVAMNLNGNDATYLTKRAAAYIELGRYNLAIQDCKAAISLDEKNVKAYLLKGKSQEMLGLEKEANEDFRRALSLDIDQRESYPVQQKVANCPRKIFSVSLCNLMVYFGWQQNLE